MKKLLLASVCASLIGLAPTSSYAELDASGDCNCGHIGNYRADSHAPLGVMGDHMHKKGEWMLSYRFMRMDMEENLIDDSRVSPEQIVTSVPNRFFGIAGQPATLRVVPVEMNTNMHMFGGMYAPSDKLTLMVMANYIDRTMDHITFQGGAGTTRLGNFTTDAQGWGDTKASALIKLYQDETHDVHFNAGMSFPTGSITNEDKILAPNGARPRLRLPYAMQLGSGTYDLMPGITYNGHNHKWGWGAQYNATIRLGENSEDYTLGDKHQMSLWGSYLIRDSISVSGRLTAETESQIDGIDSEIVAPVQTADPDNYGGRRVSASLGVNTIVPSGILKGHRFSAEVTLPVYQNLNGPQLARDRSIVFGWSKAF